VSEVRISAELRTEFGKGGARRTRRSGRVPAVIYSKGAEVRHISLPARDIMFAFRNGARPVLSIDIDGHNELAVPKSVVRDPLKGDVEHIDLMTVDRAHAREFEKEQEEAAAAAAAAEAELQAKIEHDAEVAAAHEAEDAEHAAEEGAAEGESAEGETAEAAEEAAAE
jgi:ribosomal protein L25 (general stress protein Ctc)